MCFVADHGKDTSIIKNTALISKKSIKYTSLLPEISFKCSFTRSGGMVGILILLMKRFKIDQYVLGLVFGTFNLLPRFIK